MKDLIVDRLGQSLKYQGTLHLQTRGCTHLRVNNCSNSDSRLAGEVREKSIFHIWPVDDNTESGRHKYTKEDTEFKSSNYKGHLRHKSLNFKCVYYNLD